MKFFKKISLLAFGLCLVLSLWAQPKREFRAAWLTTVWAIDWPIPYNASTASLQQKQQESLIAIVDKLAEANMNAVFFQVRGFADAMYNSKYEPWSQYLTGTRGKAPNYDPLALLIDYAHFKGIEVHAWLNPYRYASSDATYGKYHEKDYYKTHPEWLVQCGDITILNPSLPEVREQICKVVADIVENYDVDGIIFDDYFHQSGYQDSYDQEQYDATSNGMSRADWRRAQNNLMVRMVNDTIKAVKPWVKFGIGPAGVAGKANTSAPVYGVEPCPTSASDWQYNGIYADPLAWYNEHTIDYMAPQVYWKIGSSSDYDQITRWWSDMASHFNRHMYVSQSLSALRADGVSISSSQFYASEIVDQINVNRTYDRFGAPGFCWYGLSQGTGTKNFMQNIKNNATQHPAVIPQMTWYRTDDCIYVSNIREQGGMLVWDAPAPNLRYVVYQIPIDEVGNVGAAGTNRNLLGTTYTTSFNLPSDVPAVPITYAVAVLDRYGNEYPARTMDNTAWGKSLASKLVYPANKSEVLLPCYCKWNAASGADSYFFQLSKSADFSTVDYEYETVDTTFFVGKIYWLESNETYYWRVRTRSINKEDTYSDIYSFAGSFFGIVSPAHEDTVPLALAIVCDSVADSDATYAFEVASAQSFDVESIVFSDVAPSPRITLPEKVLMASHDYYVRAKVTFGGNAVVSDPIKVRTIPLDVPVPEIISPTNGQTIVGNSIIVIWKEQPSAGFRVEFSQNEIFPNRQTKRFRTDAYTYSYTYEEMLLGTWYIRLAASKEGGLTEYSPVIKVILTDQPSAVGDNYINDRPTKTIEDGQVIIYRNGECYNLLGAPHNNRTITAQ